MLDIIQASIYSLYLTLFQRPVVNAKVMTFASSGNAVLHGPMSACCKGEEGLH